MNSEVLARAGVSRSLVPRTLQSLVTLELIDENQMPTETLQNLRRVAEPEFQNALAAWISTVYADVLSFVDPTDNETAIRDAFRSYNPAGQHQRMVSLFLGLCRAAGMRQDEQPRSAARPRARGDSAAPRRIPQHTQKRIPAPEATPAPRANMPPALAGLMSSLPNSGTWTEPERDKFIKTFTAVLDFCFTVSTEQEEKSDDD
jgi:hypothetical protein